jgi:RNA polymerase sigma-70 factor, ECF subfamily
MPNDRQSNDTSLTLLERVRSSDAQAWGHLVRIYTPLLAFWAKTCNIPSLNADDVIQEIWKSVSTSIQRFGQDPDRGSFRAWLWTIAKNKARDFHRKGSLATTPTGGTEALQWIQSIPEREPTTEGDEAGFESLRLALETIEHEFEPHSWRVFLRFMYDGLSAQHVAEEFGIKANSVHQIRFRVLRRLRQEMSGLLESAGMAE